MIRRAHRGGDVALHIGEHQPAVGLQQAAPERQQGGVQRQVQARTMLSRWIISGSPVKPSRRSNSVEGLRAIKRASELA